MVYTKLALQPEQEFAWGKGKDNARSLGYAAAWLDALPDSVWESAAAVGNPFALGLLRPGEDVVDVGCGAGARLSFARPQRRSRRRRTRISTAPA